MFCEENRTKESIWIVGKKEKKIEKMRELVKWRMGEGRMLLLVMGGRGRLVGWFSGDGDGWLFGKQGNKM